MLSVNQAQRAVFVVLVSKDVSAWSVSTDCIHVILQLLLNV